jgi:endonuclease/exonuclease/phosphatase family metal-dependent hydrolase
MQAYDSLNLFERSRTNTDAMQKAWQRSVNSMKVKPFLKPKNSTRIISWNIHNSTNVFQEEKGTKMKEWVTRQNPDVVIFQEACDNCPPVPDGFELLHNDTAIGLTFAAKKGLVTNVVACNLPWGKGDKRRGTIRGYIGSFEIVGTHLDVYDKTGDTRVQQIQSLLSSRNNPSTTLVVGDLNFARQSDYSGELWERFGPLPTAAWDVIEGNRWNDVIGENGFSVWSGRRVDYALMHKSSTIKVNAHFGVTSLSDHLPIVVDVTL